MFFAGAGALEASRVDSGAALAGDRGGVFAVAAGGALGEGAGWSVTADVVSTAGGCAFAQLRQNPLHG